jgi:hypothetical protein
MSRPRRSPVKLVLACLLVVASAAMAPRDRHAPRAGIVADGSTALAVNHRR